MDIERERFDDLLKHFLKPIENSEEDEKKENAGPQSVREINNWAKQKIRLQQQSIREFNKFRDEQLKSNSGE